jgi:hypothetical protein
MPVNCGRYRLNSSTIDEIRGLTTATGFTIVGRDKHGSVERYDSAGAHQTWRWSAPGWVHNDPLIDEGRVVVTCGDSHPNNARNDSTTMLGRTGGVASLDMASGTPVWVHPGWTNVPSGRQRMTQVALASAPPFTSVDLTTYRAYVRACRTRPPPADGCCLSATRAADAFRCLG